MKWHLFRLFLTISGSALIITKTHSPGDLFRKGETLVQYTATDLAGNNRTCEIHIVIRGLFLKCLHFKWFVLLKSTKEYSSSEFWFWNSKLSNLTSREDPYNLQVLHYHSFILLKRKLNFLYRVFCVYKYNSFWFLRFCDVSICANWAKFFLFFLKKWLINETDWKNTLTSSTP